MRKLCMAFSILIVILLYFAVNVFSAGTVSVSTSRASGNVWITTYTCTADSSDGSFPATDSDVAINGYVFLVVTNPGATAPTDDYDITLTDSDSVDVMGGTLANRDTANSEQAVPYIGSVYGSRFVSGVLTATITNNSENSAIVEIIVYFYR